MRFAAWQIKLMMVALHLAAVPVGIWAGRWMFDAVT
jgi:hypothetical protein